MNEIRDRHRAKFSALCPALVVLQGKQGRASGRVDSPALMTVSGFHRLCKGCEGKGERCVGSKQRVRSRLFKSLINFPFSSKMKIGLFPFRRKMNSN